MQIQVNGELRSFTDGITVQMLLERLKIQPEIVAVELNEVVLPRTRFPETPLKEGDVVEVVRMVGGGALFP